MRLKTILCSMAALSMMAGFSSCSNEEDVKVPVENAGVNLTDCETVSIAVNMPVGMRTRAGETPTMTYGSDGLYSFSRTIDKLWYAVYNKGTLLYHSLQSGIKQGVYDEDTEAFKLDIQIPRINEQINLEDYTVFFFAGNAADKVATSEITDGIGLDFTNKTMYAYPTMLNATTASGEMYNPVQYDYFAKYIALDKVVDSDYNGSVTLVRPFCQVSLLTDELCNPAVLSAYASDGKVAVNTTPTVNSAATNTLPYGWNYGTDEILTKAISMSLDARAFNNADDTYTIPQQVTFKERRMFCVASYLMLAPETRKSYIAGADSEKFSFDLTVTGDRNSTDASVAANIPAGGLKANEKYVMYNRDFSGKPDPDDPDPKDPDEGGEGGILSSHYVLDIVVDPDWDGNKNIVY